MYLYVPQLCRYHDKPIYDEARSLCTEDLDQRQQEYTLFSLQCPLHDTATILIHEGHFVNVQVFTIFQEVGEHYYYHTSVAGCATQP